MNYLFPERGRLERGGMLWLAIWAGFILWLVLAQLAADAVRSWFPDPKTYAAIYAVNFARFVPLWLIAWLTPRLLGRPSFTVFSWTPRFNWRWFGIGFGLWLSLNLAMTGVDVLANRGGYAWAFDSGNLPLAIAIVLLFLPLQTSAEEFFFRGLLPQAVSQITRRPLLIAVASGFVFALPHLGNPEATDQLFWAVIAYGAMGAGWTYAAAKVGSLEIAIGAHFANNLFGLVIVGYEDSALPAVPLWFTGAASMPVAAGTGVISALVFGALVRRRVSRV